MKNAEKIKCASHKKIIFNQWKRFEIKLGKRELIERNNYSK